MKTIQLKSNGIGRYEDVSPFIITDSRLELKIELPAVNGEFYLVAENNSAKYKLLVPRGESIELDKLTAGELQAEVKHYLKGELIKTYKVEPLILKEVDGNLTGTPEIAALSQSNAELVKSFEEYKEETAKSEKQARMNFLALVRIVWSLYQTNIYLDDVTFEEFISRYGIQLTDEEIQLIKGENRND